MPSSTKDCYPARDNEVVQALKGLSRNTSFIRAYGISLFSPLALTAFNLTAVDHAGTYDHTCGHTE